MGVDVLDMDASREVGERVNADGRHLLHMIFYSIIWYGVLYH